MRIELAIDLQAWRSHPQLFHSGVGGLGAAYASHLSLVSPFRCASPASVTRVPLRPEDERLVISFRCARPASVT